MKAVEPLPPRPYRQTRRAAAAAETAARILDAFERAIREKWFDQVTLEEVAREAEVAVPTVLRRFGGKEGLLEAVWRRMGEGVRARQRAPPGDVRGAVRVIVEDYEQLGDLVMRALAQEDRYPAFRAMNDIGRAHHRGWIEEAFAPWLCGLPAGEHERRVDALVAATDIYLWKLVRRDMGRPPRALRHLMLTLIGGVIGEAVAPGEDTDA